MENNKELIKFEQKQNKLSKAREIYFKYFTSQRMSRMKASVRWKAMMAMLLAHSVIPTKCSSEMTGKGQTPRVSIKWLDQMRSKLMPKVTNTSTVVLSEIRKFQKSTELLIPKMPFLRLVKEIIQRDHGDHYIQMGAVLALHKATEAYFNMTIRGH